MSHQALRIVETTDFATTGVVVLGQSEMWFGRYCARPAARELTRDGEPVCIGSRAFDLLVVLLQSRGNIVSKDDIVGHVWPTTIVDESNLRFQMATLRKAIGEERDRIKTIPGRGYLFTVGDDRPRTVRPMEINLSPDRPAIVIIDRDPASREAIFRLLQPIRAQIQSFGSLQAFLESDALLAH